MINRDGIARLSLHDLAERFDLEEIDSLERCPTIFQLSASGLPISLSNGGKSDFVCFFYGCYTIFLVQFQSPSLLY